ncbi:hypothetical protein DC007_14690, partial [Enterococcus faecalis]
QDWSRSRAEFSPEEFLKFVERRQRETAALDIDLSLRKGTVGSSDSKTSSSSNGGNGKQDSGNGKAQSHNFKANSVVSGNGGPGSGSGAKGSKKGRPCWGGCGPNVFHHLYKC